MLYFFKIIFSPPPAQGFPAAMAMSPGQCAVHSCAMHTAQCGTAGGSGSRGEGALYSVQGVYITTL